jgi:septal ring factor EnvC (AmiA/AmiB activator)
MKTFESNMTTQTSIDRIDADIKALKATLSAHGKRLDTQDKRLDALEALLGASDSKKVTNKLRSVC